MLYIREKVFNFLFFLFGKKCICVKKCIDAINVKKRYYSGDFWFLYTKLFVKLLFSEQLKMSQLSPLLVFLQLEVKLYNSKLNHRKLTTPLIYNSKLNHNNYKLFNIKIKGVILFDTRNHSISLGTCFKVCSCLSSLQPKKKEILTIS